MATRRKILDAAIVEFSHYGIAGARVDRIAATAGASKGMIYTYFASKQGLFDAVFDAIVVQTMDDVPMDVADLPGYAAGLFDQHRKHPEVIRIGGWDELERDGAGRRLDAVVAANRSKVDKIARAQSGGHLSGRFSASSLLELILPMTRFGMTIAGTYDDETLAEERRETIREAVRTLIDQ